VFDARIGDVSGRGKLGGDMREIWMMQPRFEKRSGHSPFGLVEQPRFRAGFDFMRLRADVGEVDEPLVDWWQAFSLADESAREDLVQQLRAEQQKLKKAPRVHSVKKAAPAQSGSAQTAPENIATADDADAQVPTPAKRRRRRRKPGGGAGGAPNAAAPDTH